jgi:hypothetical protein
VTYIPAASLEGLVGVRAVRQIEDVELHAYRTTEPVSVRIQQSESCHFGFQFILSEK